MARQIKSERVKVPENIKAEIEAMPEGQPEPQVGREGGGGGLERVGKDN